MQHDIIFMMGPSGVGKGTQSKLLAQELGYFHWEMGAILRSMADLRLKNGQILRDYMNAGNFVSDEDIMEVFYGKVKEMPGKKIIFDGIPRRLGQARELVEHFKAQGFENSMTIYLDAPEDELVRRLLERAKTEGRADDREEVIKRRLDQFRELTAPAIEYLKGATTFHQIDGRPPIADVHQSILAALAPDA